MARVIRPTIILQILDISYAYLFLIQGFEMSSKISQEKEI